MGISTELQGKILRYFEMPLEEVRRYLVQRKRVDKQAQGDKMKTISYDAEHTEAMDHDSVMDYFMQHIQFRGFPWIEYNMADGKLTLTYED